MTEFDVLGAAAAGMDAQRSALDLAARNVAAAQASDGPGGFERLVPRFAVARHDAGDPDGFEPADPDADGTDGEAPPPIRYLGASAERGADVDSVTEMVSVLSAQRAYEGDAAVFDLGKRLAERTIDLGRLQ